MSGREDKKSNDLFYTCSLIGYIAGKTSNKPSYIVSLLGKEAISKIYELADVYHSDNIDRVADDLITDHNITNGSFDNVAECEYSIPTHWDIGKVYKRLILAVSENSGDDIISSLMNAYSSKIVDLIEDYNSSFYYDNPGTIFATYQNNCIPE
ncbi:hypothetical protein [Ruminococcus flavefaciens]|uniref:hypothetical protein n=1 Tax=Ruminococcus flavefaciens TaxID=1265 RepID=UPI000491C2B8|nr:hypothetical protein [Ruminococcus flavefaciens]